MEDYDVKKIKKISKSSKTDYFKNNTNHKRKKKHKNKKTNGFWDVPDQYINQDNSELDYDYISLERRLEIDIQQWGVESIANKIINLIKENYKDYTKNKEHKEEVLIHSFYPKAKKALKNGYKKARDILPPLPNDIQKLIVATYSKSIDELKKWFDYNHNQKLNLSNEIKYSPPETIELTKKITNLLVEQGIYLEEKKVHHPIINTTR